MYNISTEMNTALNKFVRDESYIRITYGLFDATAPSKATKTDNGHLFYSDVANVDNLDKSVEYTYETLEENRFCLNGTSFIQPTDIRYYQGFVSDVMSNSDSMFTVNPSITIEFSEYMNLSGLTFTFDEIKGDYPSEFMVLAYNNTTLVKSVTCTPNSSFFLTKEQFLDINKLTITFTKTNKPYRRIRLNNLLYGLIIKLTTQNIDKCILERSIEIGSFELPKNNFQFDIIDLVRDYDPENPNNLLQFIDAGQKIESEFGQKLSSGVIEWIPLSTTFSTGETSVSDGSFFKIVNVKSGSILDTLTMIYDEAVYVPTGISYFALLTNILNFAGVTEYFNIPQVLKNYTTNVVLKDTTVKDYIQLIVNACNCNFYIDRTGIINIVPIPFGTSEFNLTAEKTLDEPKLSTLPKLRNFISGYYTPTLEPVGELASVEIENAVNLKVEVTYDASTNITCTPTGLTIIGIPQIFSTKTVLFVTGSGIINIGGNKLKYNEVTTSKSVNETGIDLQLSNSLISNKATLDAWSTYQIGLFTKVNSYALEDRSYPQLDITDDVIINNAYGDSIKGKIISNKFTFTGSITGETTIVAE